MALNSHMSGHEKVKLAWLEIQRAKEELRQNRQKIEAVVAENRELSREQITMSKAYIEMADELVRLSGSILI